ncbi:hypothetical protein TNCV_1585431 [Trichonephila clavipes]|nr:hypothetical protein TNCV_1585431 [Trichonephila clavipes]
MGHLIEEVVDFARQINLEVDSEDFQELPDSHHQELTIDELIEMKMEHCEDQTLSSVKYKESEIIYLIKIQKIKWAGHVAKMDEDRTITKAFNA